MYANFLLCLLTNQHRITQNENTIGENKCILTLFWDFLLINRKKNCINENTICENKSIQTRKFRWSRGKSHERRPTDENLYIITSIWTL